MAEVHVGVKFEVVHLSEEKIEDPRVGELIRIGKELAERGFCPNLPIEIKRLVGTVLVSIEN